MVEVEYKLLMAIRTLPKIMPRTQLIQYQMIIFYSLKMHLICCKKYLQQMSIYCTPNLHRKDMVLAGGQFI